MKVKKFLKGMMLAVSVLLAAGCSSLFDTGESGSEKKEDGFVINLGLNNPGARLIRAFDYDLSNFTTWTVEFKQTADDVTTTVYSLEAVKAGDSHGSNTAYVQYNDSKLTARYIAEGSYDVELTGSYTPESSSTKYQVFGVTSVTIGENGTGSATVLVGPKKNSSGALSLSLADSGAFYNTELYSSDSDGLLSSVKATLKSIDGETSYTVTSSAEAGTEASYEGENGGKLSIVYTVGTGDTQIPSLTFTLAGSDIPSGWYSLSFSVVDSDDNETNNYRVYLPEHPDAFVEIADGCTTASTDVSISVDTVKTYYATNDSSTYNGLSAASRANLNTLLDTLSDALPSEGTIRIYVDGTPDIDIKAFSDFKDAIAAATKTVYIYNADSLEVIKVEGSGSSSATTLSNSVELTPNGTSNTLAVDSIALQSDIKLTLNNTAAVSATTVTLNSYTIKVYAVSSTTTDGTTTTKDNLSAYSGTPFLTAGGSDISSSISLYDYDSDDVTEKYAVVSTGSTTEVSTGSTSYYIKPAGSSEIKAASFAETVYISAAYSSDKETSYKTGDAIPYTDDTLEFTLKDFTDTATVTWYLNKDTALTGATAGTATTDSDGNKTTTSPYTYSASFNPYTQGGFNIDDTNTVSCYVTISGNTEPYLAEMSFTFSATRSAVVWYDGINSTSDASAASATYALKQVYDYKSTAASELVTADSSTLYCFDTDCNLWTAVLGDSGLTLTKYLMIVGSGLYSTSGSSSTIGSITETPIDMTYDTVNRCLYLLTDSSNSGYKLYKVSLSGTGSTYTLSFVKGTVAITDSSVKPVQIAVSDNTLYIGADSATIYKATLAESDGELAIETTTSPWAVLYEETEAFASCTVTDMQIEDGLGNEAGNLYVLLRQYSSYIGVTGTETTATASGNLVYSRGALVKVAIADSEPSCYEYGWAETKSGSVTTEDSTTIQDSSGNYGTLYAPLSSDDDSKFYGPTHFAAVVPKKLIILDDGVAYNTYNKQGYIDNKDSLVEFDISGSALTRGASVSATKPDTSGFTIN